MKILFTIRRWVGLLILCCLFTVPAALFVSTTPVYADGEQLTFTDENTIIGTGGDIWTDSVITFRKQANGTYVGNLTKPIGLGLSSINYTISGITKDVLIGGYNGQIVGDEEFTEPKIVGAVHIADPNGRGPNGGNPSTANPGEPDQNTDEEKVPEDCPIPDEEPFEWAFCPMFIGINRTTNVLDSFINTYLSTGNEIFSGKQAGYEEAWKTFRNFGIGLLVIAGLVMLISEALGLAIIDAYTVRKLLPRLLVAIIGITVSWDLCEFIIGFFDDLGAAMGNIIYSSFGIGVKGINISDTIGVALLGTGAATAVALTLGAMGIISLMGTLILAMLIGTIVLILRQAIIVAAVLLAPLAIAAYVLPNTNKLANFWWDTFIRMLMLYPIATGIIALCKVMGNITMGDPTNVQGNGVAGGLGEGISSLIALISGMVFFIGGYALIPLAFRLTGGLVATIGGMANDRTRGGFDRLKNFRKGQTEKNIHAMGEGRRFANNRFGTRTFNRATRGAGNFSRSQNKLGYMSPFKSSRVAARRAGGTAGVVDQAGEFAKSKEAQALMENDPALQALTYRDAASARAGLKRDFGMTNNDQIEAAIRAVQAGGGWSAGRAQFAAKQLYATGTGYSNAKQAIETANRVSGNNDNSYSDIVGYGNSVTAQKGRFDLKGGYGEYMRQRNILKAQSAAGRPVGVSEAQQNAFYREAVEGNDAVSFLRGKPGGMKNVAPVIREQMIQQQSIAENTHHSDAVREKARYQTARYGSIIETFEQQGAMYAAPNVKQIVHKQMVRPTSGEPIVVDFDRDPVPVGANRQTVNDQAAKQAYTRDAAGNVVLDARGRPLKGPNMDYSPGANAGSAEQGTGRNGDPRTMRDRLDE